MRCEVCGQDYGLTHNCAGGAGHILAAEPEVATEKRTLAYYIRLGWSIAFWDQAGIEKASRDPRALVYGAAFFVPVFWLTAGVATVRLVMAGRMTPAVAPFAFIFGSVIGTLWGSFFMLTYFFVCHIVARAFLGGTGKFIGVLRPLALSSFLMILSILPFVGKIAVSIWWGIGVTLGVFEEVHHVDRFKTLGVIVALRLASFLLLVYTPLGKLSGL